jgi:hypothetical protein
MRKFGVRLALVEKHNRCTVLFVFSGPDRHISHQKERPIQMVWQRRIKYESIGDQFKRQNRRRKQN